MLAALDNLVQSIVFKLDSIIKLFLRLIIGFVFIPSGWGKLHNIPQVVEYFQSLHIPAAHIQVPFVAGMELIMGFCVAFGLFTRMATIPLMGILVVALITAKIDDIKDINTLLDQTEFLYMAILVAILNMGPGLFSADHWLFKRK